MASAVTPRRAQAGRPGGGGLEHRLDASGGKIHDPLDRIHEKPGFRAFPPRHEETSGEGVDAPGEPEEQGQVEDREDLPPEVRQARDMGGRAGKGRDRPRARDLDEGVGFDGVSLLPEEKRQEGEARPCVVVRRDSPGQDAGPLLEQEGDLAEAVHEPSFRRDPRRARHPSANRAAVSPSERGTVSEGGIPEAIPRALRYPRRARPWSPSFSPAEAVPK